MMQSRIPVGWLLACALGGAFVACPARGEAQVAATPPIVRLYPSYSIEDASGNQFGQTSAGTVVTLCPSLSGTEPVAQVCPGTSASNPLYVSGGGTGTGTGTVIGVTTTQTVGSTSPVGGTYTVALPAAGPALRRGCTIQNTSAGTEYVVFGAGKPSVLEAGLAIAAGTPLDCAHGGVVVAQDTVWIASAGASASYVLLAQ